MPRAAYFMVNCAHPTHFADALAADGAWLQRLVGLRANASTRSHAELDEATELDEGDPADLGARHAALRDRLPAVTVLGGCCGTDARHVAAIFSAWSAELGCCECPRSTRSPTGRSRLPPRRWSGRPVCWREHGDARAPVRAGVGDQAAGRPRRAGRDRGGRRRTRHPGGPARLDGAPSARARLGVLDALDRS